MDNHYWERANEAITHSGLLNPEVGLQPRKTGSAQDERNRAVEIVVSLQLHLCLQAELGDENSPPQASFLNDQPLSRPFSVAKEIDYRPMPSRQLIHAAHAAHGGFGRTRPSQYLLRTEKFFSS